MGVISTPGVTANDEYLRHQMRQRFAPPPPPVMSAPTPTPDLDSMAAKYGGKSVSGTTPDLDALAKKYGGSVSTSPVPLSEQDSTLGGLARIPGNLWGGIKATAEAPFVNPATGDVDLSNVGQNIVGNLWLKPALESAQHVSDVAAAHGKTGTVTEAAGRAIAAVPFAGPWVMGTEGQPGLAERKSAGGILTEGLGTLAAGEMMPHAAGAMGHTALPLASDLARRAMQEGLNIGPSQTLRIESQIAQANSEMARAHTEKLAKFNEDFQATRSGDRATYEKQLRDLQAQNAADAADHQQQVQAIRQINAQRAAAHQAQVNAINSANVTELAKAAKRVQLTNDLTDHGDQIAVNTKLLEQAVRAQGGNMFDAVRDAVRDGKADPAALQSAVEHARSKILAGSPENIKIFNSILGDLKPEESAANPVTFQLEGTAKGLGYKNYADAISKIGQEQFNRYLPPELQNVPMEQPSIGWNDLQGYYTELGQQMGVKSLPSDVWRALKYVKDEGIGDQMSQMARRAGAESQWNAARKFWTQYEQTFHNMQPIAQGGSPVARAFRAADPDAALAPFVKGAAGMRGIDSLRTFGDGGNALADTIQAARAKWNQAQSLPKTAKIAPIPNPPVPKAEPAPFVPKEAPDMAKLRSTGEPPSLKLQTMPDPRLVKQASVQRIAEYLRGEGGWRAWSDVAALEGAGAALFRNRPLAAAGLSMFPVMRRLVGAGLERPSFLEWVSKPSAAEMQLKGGTPLMRTPPPPPTVTYPPGAPAPTAPPRP